MPYPSTSSAPPRRVSPLYFIIVLSVIAIVAGVAFLVRYSNTAAPAPSTTTAQKISKLAGAQKQNGFNLIDPSLLVDDPNSPFTGASPSEAKITVVEFLDFQCPYSQASASVVKQLIARYKGQPIRFVFRNLPIENLHPYAVSAAHASLCANAQKKYLPLYDLLYARQSDINPDNIYVFARDAGLNMNIFSQCMAKGTYQTQIQKDFSDGVALGAQGTPTWFINGQSFEGALSFETMSTIIDKMLGAK